MLHQDGVLQAQREARRDGLAEETSGCTDVPASPIALVLPVASPEQSQDGGEALPREGRARVFQQPHGGVQEEVGLVVQGRACLHRRSRRARRGGAPPARGAARRHRRLACDGGLGGGTLHREKVAHANLKGGEVGDFERGERLQKVVARGEGGFEEARLTEGRQHSRRTTSRRSAQT